MEKRQNAKPYSLATIAFWTLTAMGVLFILLLGFFAAPLEKSTPDANTYLDIGRNLSRGEGFVTDYNQYQGWTGLRKDAFPYQQPLLPLVHAFIPVGEKALLTANGLNSVFAALAILAYALAWRSLLAPWKAALAMMPVAFSPDFYDVYSVPLTEPLSLLIIALAFLALVRSDRLLVPAGLLFGLSIFLRSANVMGILGLVVGLTLINGKERWKRSACFVMAALGPLAVVELASLYSNGELYPAYGSAARTYRMTRDFGGAIYQSTRPTLLFAGQITPKIFASMLYHNALAHLTGLIGAAGWIICSLGVVGAFGKRKIDKCGHGKLLIFFAGGYWLLISLMFHHLHQDFTFDRYALQISALMLPLAVLGIDYFVEKKILPQKLGVAIVVIGLVLLSGFNGVQTQKKYQRDRGQFLDPQIQQIYFTQPQQWIQKHTSPRALVATNYFMRAYHYDRPIISLPVNKQLSAKNLALFIVIHKPGAILVDVGNEYLPGWMKMEYQDLLAKLNYSELERNERFMFFKRLEN